MASIIHDILSVAVTVIYGRSVPNIGSCWFTTVIDTVGGVISIPRETVIASDSFDAVSRVLSVPVCIHSRNVRVKVIVSAKSPFVSQAALGTISRQVQASVFCGSFWQTIAAETS